MMMRDAKGRFTKKATVKAMPKRDAKGRFIKEVKKASVKRDAKGRFVKKSVTGTSTVNTPVTYLEDETKAKSTKDKYLKKLKALYLDLMQACEDENKKNNTKADFTSFKASLKDAFDTLDAKAIALSAEEFFKFMDAMSPSNVAQKSDLKAEDCLTTDECEDSCCCDCKDCDQFEEGDEEDIMIPAACKQYVREVTAEFVEMLKEVFSKVNKDLKVEVIVRTYMEDKEDKEDTRRC